MAGKAATAMQKMDLLRTDPETRDAVMRELAERARGGDDKPFMARAVGAVQWEYKGKPVVPGSRAERRRHGRG